VEKWKNKIIFGDFQNMKELEDNEIHLVVSSPPYFNDSFEIELTMPFNLCLIAG